MEKYTIHKRTFEAKKHEGEKREKLNRSSITSEYMPSYKYALIGENCSLAFKTKKEAEK